MFLFATTTAITNAATTEAGPNVCPYSKTTVAAAITVVAATMVVVGIIVIAIIVVVTASTSATATAVPATETASAATTEAVAVTTTGMSASAYTQLVEVDMLDAERATGFPASKLRGHSVCSRARVGTTGIAAPVRVAEERHGGGGVGGERGKTSAGSARVIPARSDAVLGVESAVWEGALG
ncbi:hypothetical protein F5Y05DRAFT_415078 [Hypoxylon sp. FL0543]|nr:hypothetical protein F5Y05DRAFT_415078 [Hypoxylon sp. FL0543]